MDKKEPKHSFSYVVCDEHYSLPKVLTEKQPFKNKKTGEIQYLSWWELYVDRQKEIMDRAIMYGMGITEHKLHIDDWEIMQETLALKFLYGPKKVK